MMSFILSALLFFSPLGPGVVIAGANPWTIDGPSDPHPPGPHGGGDDGEVDEGPPTQDQDCTPHCFGPGSISR